MTRHGLPAATTPGSTSFTTTLPAPITEPSPIVTPGQMTAAPPIQASSSTVTGRPSSRPEALSATDVGCVARVVRAAPSGGGRWVLVARGERRIRVDEWLSDAPFPRARVTEWPDPAESEGARIELVQARPTTFALFLPAGAGGLSKMTGPV